MCREGLRLKRPARPRRLSRKSSVQRISRIARSDASVSSEVVMTDPAALVGDDVQARRPVTRVSLSRVGVPGVEKVPRIRWNDSEQLFYAELECFVDLPP